MHLSFAASSFCNYFFFIYHILYYLKKKKKDQQNPQLVSFCFMARHTDRAALKLQVTAERAQKSQWSCEF